jgi:hypothetical protein
MTPEKADAFARKLSKLCRQEGVMIWTAFVTTPMMISDVDIDTTFYYVAEPNEAGNGYTVRRVLKT